MSIRKRESSTAKNGVVYEVYIYYYVNGVRKRFSKSGFNTKKEAQAFEVIKQTELLTNETQNLAPVTETKKTLLEVMDEFILVGGVQYQANTIYNTKKDVRYFKDELGNMPIASIDYKFLQTYFNKRKDQGIETNKNIRKSLNRIFKYAVRCNYIKTNPVQYVIVTGEDKGKAKSILRFEDFKRLIEAIEEKNKFRYDSFTKALEIGYYTGLRASEVMALEKEDFDFTNEVIHIEKKLVFKGLKKNEYYSTKEMKSKKSKAIIPFPRVLQILMKEWFKKNPYKIVICDDEGCYINPTCLTNDVKKISKKLGIEFNFHMLRHTYATTLVTHDVDVKTAQELLRHSNYNTTLSIYTHISESHKKQVVNDVFDNLMSN